MRRRPIQSSLLRRSYATCLVYAENGADRLVAIDRFEVRHAGLEIDVDQPGLSSVDRINVSRLLRIERERGPGRYAALFAQHRQQARRTDVTRLNMLKGHISTQHRADGFPDAGAAAIAADQIAAGDLHHPSLHVRRPRQDAVIGLSELRQRSRRKNAGVWHLFEMCEQHRLQIDLVDPVRWLRRGPVGVGASRGSVAVCAAWDLDAGDLASEKGRAIGNVVGIIRRQAGVAYFFSHAEPAEDFH